MPVRLGCVYLPQFAPERIAATARAADAAGLDELWLWEDCFLAGGVSAAAIALANSERLTVGVGVLPAPLRNVALTAMELATLHRAFPGRVRTGVGHGVQNWMEQVGAKVRSPMTLLREYVACLTALLRGETVTFHGRYVSLEDVTLDWPPAGSVELLTAAVGPKTLALSGELSDGTILTQGTTPDQVRDAITHIAAHRRHSIVTYVLCAEGDGAAHQINRELERWNLDPATDVHASGGAADIATSVRRWVDAGTDTVVLQPPLDARVEDFVRFLGEQVAPLVR
ncbi:LLM class flavin-dependent oxidoreductase [Mycobacterium sp. PS03-16]|uniref:LLM class flavin-dependent oxidoreductase n=1 Tax=Mycobacterium sp. PS03-16 TaxID=2559611 RepID=UPI0010744BE5|nr:LLM class flavin-dependent oxidoreductase [Mycobacterium sp. PS03-16]TFV60752.1 LLM class flavin-dependent oxidoreductase [Mycobacterium sp. PS03-16]